MLDYKTATKSQLEEEMKHLASKVTDTAYGTKKEFFHLPKIPGADELPQTIAIGSIEGHTGLIWLTNKRLIFLNKGLTAISLLRKSKQGMNRTI